MNLHQHLINILNEYDEQKGPIRKKLNTCSTFISFIKKLVQRSHLPSRYRLACEILRTFPNERNAQSRIAAIKMLDACMGFSIKLSYEKLLYLYRNNLFTKYNFMLFTTNKSMLEIVSPGDEKNHWAERKEYFLRMRRIKALNNEKKFFKKIASHKPSDSKQTRLMRLIKGL